MTDLVFQASDNAPQRLVILLHGVGSSARDVGPIGQALSDRLPDARIVVLDGFDPFDMAPTGRQWFSVRGVTPENRTARVDAALPRLIARIEEERLKAGVNPDAVGLFGFSQGAILSLAMAVRGFPLGAVVIAAGRLAAPVHPATKASPQVLFLHGSADNVIPIHEGQDAAARLKAAGYRVSFETQAGQGHGVSPPQIAAAADWFAALAGPDGSASARA